jgi:hypothetical protein
MAYIFERLEWGLGQKKQKQVRNFRATGRNENPADLLEVIEKVGGGAWTRTTDLRIMRPSL